MAAAVDPWLLPAELGARARVGGVAETDFEDVGCAGRDVAVHRQLGRARIASGLKVGRDDGGLEPACGGELLVEVAEHVGVVVVALLEGRHVAKKLLVDLRAREGHVAETPALAGLVVDGPDGLAKRNGDAELALDEFCVEVAELQGRVREGALELLVLGVVEHVALLGDAALLKKLEDTLVGARARDVHVDVGNENGLARNDRDLETTLVLDRHGDRGLVVAECAQGEPDGLVDVHAGGGRIGVACLLEWFDPGAGVGRQITVKSLDVDPERVGGERGGGAE